MPTFMEKCNCKGIKPAKVLGRKYYSRPEVLVNLLQDRHVARLLKAPAGSGKSSLAFEYTNIVFGFERVFWIDCTSPCFLRDLDNGTMFRSVMDIDKGTVLVVCEDIPSLDQHRAELFNSFVDDLLNVNIEVLLTCTPASDTFSHFQRDAIVLDASDMLLTDLEMESAESAGLLGGKRVADALPRDRIACTIWGDDGNRMLLSGLRNETLDIETKLAMFSMLVFRDASTDSLKDLIKPEAVGDILDTISSSYMCFGLDRRLMSFKAIDCSIEDISVYFCKDISSLCSGSVHKDKDSLCYGIADILLDQGQFKRACEFLALFADRKCGVAWLRDNGMELLHNGEAESFLYLFGKVKRAVTKDRGSIDMLVMLALFQVDDIQAMSMVGKRILKSKTSSVRSKAAAGSLILRCASRYPEIESPQKMDAIRMGVKEALSSGAVFENEESGLDIALMSDLSSSLDSSPQALMMNIASKLSGLENSSEDERYREGSEDALFLGISWLFEKLDSRNPEKIAVQRSLLEDNGSTEEYLERHSALDKIFGYICSYIEHANATEVSGYYACRAALSFKRIDNDLLSLFEIQKDKRQFAVFDRFDAKLMERRDVYRRRQKSDEESKREYALTHPDAFRRGSSHSIDKRSAHFGVPTMHVKLFGCMEIRIGDEPIDPSSIYRKKTKTLIALLVLGRDRECARDQLAQELWPETNIVSARRNFYAVIAELRKALSFEGSCPYLIRTQTGYRLDMRLVTSDVYEFEDVCRSLLFDKTEAPEWEHMYAKVTRDFSGTLMPFETDNETIVSLRKHLKLQLVDGLVATSTRLINDGQQRGALWFAREAINHDDKREDVYIALMEAQIACEQRGEALETYFKCIRFLSDELGIDPSIRLVELYRSIIETEEDF